MSAPEPLTAADVDRRAGSVRRRTRMAAAGLVLAAFAVLVAATTANAAQQVIQNGYNGACLDADTNTMAANGTKVQLWQCNGSIEQQWYVDPVGGALQIRSADSGRCLDADTNTISQDGTIVQLWDCNGLPQQRWTQVGHTIYNALSGRVLDADVNTISQNGTKVQLWALDQPSQPQQQWFSTAESAQISASPTTLTIPDGHTAPTTISWTAPSPQAGVEMSINGGAWQTVAQGASGSIPVSVTQGTTQLAIVWGDDPTEQLATTTVTATSPDPPLCGLTPTGPALQVTAWFAGHRRRHHPQATTARYGSQPTIDGVVTNPQGTPLANQSVCVVGQPLDDGGRQVYGRAVTDAAGRFSYRLPAGLSRTVSVAADTGGGPVIHHLRLAVKTAVRLRPSPARLHDHQRVLLVGRVAGPLPAGGVFLLLQVWRTGRWQTFESVATAPSGRFRGSWLFLNTIGVVTYRMRALIPIQDDYPYARTASRSITVRVTQ